MNLVINQNRHILSMIGVPLWVGRTHATSPLPVMGDRLQTSADVLADMLIDDVLVDEVQTHDDYHDDRHDDYHDRHDEVGHGGGNIPQIITNDTSVDTPDDSLSTHSINVSPSQSAPIAPTAVSRVDISYHLKGVRFGRWVLVLDMRHVDTDVHSVWLSLCDALKRQADKTGIIYDTHEVAYPLVRDEYAEHQSFSPASQVCLGFVLRLTMPDLTDVKIGLLTPLTEGLSIENAYSLTDIRLLAKYNNQKQAFWQFIIH